MKLLPAAAALTCAVFLSSCGRQTASTSDDSQRIAEEQQAEALSQLHEKQAALDEKERVLNQREQQLTISAEPPPESTPPPAGPVAAPAAQPQATAPAYSIDASYQTFYDQLAPYGSWITMDPYGYVWQPSATLHDINWRPYTLGHWAYTDDGWTWMSDEPFGWITYHYGRWMRTHTLGWVWTPDDQWAPAWVSWRYGNDFVGWAPLPPEARFDGASGIQQWADSQYDLGASDYTFVPSADFGEGSMADYEVPPDQAGPIYDESSNITNIYYDSGVYAIICYGPSYDFMRSKSHRPLPPQLSIKRYGYRHDGRNAPTVAGGTLRVPAPRVIRTTRPAAPKAVNSRVFDARLVTPASVPPPHGAPVPPLYQPPASNQALPVARVVQPARQEAAPRSQPEIVPPEIQRTTPPPPPPAAMRLPIHMEPPPIAPTDETGRDQQIIQQQQAAREAERRQEEGEAARTAAEQQQRAQELQRAEQQRAQQQQAQEQRAEELRSEENARQQQAAQEAANAAAARESEARQAAERAVQSSGIPTGAQTPGGRGN